VPVAGVVSDQRPDDSAVPDEPTLKDGTWSGDQVKD